MGLERKVQSPEQQMPSRTDRWAWTSSGSTRSLCWSVYLSDHDQKICERILQLKKYERKLAAWEKTLNTLHTKQIFMCGITSSRKVKIQNKHQKHQIIQIHIALFHETLPNGRRSNPYITGYTNNSCEGKEIRNDVKRTEKNICPHVKTDRQDLDPALRLHWQKFNLINIYI